MVKHFNAYELNYCKHLRVTKKLMGHMHNIIWDSDMLPKNAQ